MGKSLECLTPRYSDSTTLALIIISQFGAECIYTMHCIFDLIVQTQFSGIDIN